MPNMLFANNCNTTLASSLTSGATSMSVTSATGFPSPTGVQYFYCTLADAATQTTIEIVKVTAVSGTTFAITRAQDGTSATAFAAGAVVSLRLVRASLNDFPKLDETNTFNADQAISGQLTSSAGLATTGTFTATAPSDGLVMDYATGFGRFSAFAGDGFQWYNAGIANTKLMQLSSSGVITTATWNGATVGVGYGGTGLAAVTAGYIPFGNSASALNTDSGLYWDNTNKRLGVNNTSPSYGLDVVSTLAVGGGGTDGSLWIKRASGSALGQITWVTATDNFKFVNNNGGIYTWFNNTTEQMRLFASGGLSLGNTTDPGKGNLSLTAASDCNITMSSSAGAYSSNLTMNSSSGGGSAIRAPYALIGITGGSGGVILNSGATSWSSFSDKRLKNITGIYDNALSDISKLQPVKFTWKADESNKPCVGVIAQSVETVIPEAIDSRASIDGDSTKYLSVRYTDIIPLMIASIQELNSNLTTLQASYDAYVASHP